MAPDQAFSEVQEQGFIQLMAHLVPRFTLLALAAPSMHHSPICAALFDLHTHS